MPRSVTLQWDANLSLDEVRTKVETTLLPAFDTYNFKVRRHTDALIELERRRSPWYLMLFSLLAFALSPDEKSHVTISYVSTARTACQMVISGDVPTKIRRLLLEVPGCREIGP